MQVGRPGRDLPGRRPRLAIGSSSSGTTGPNCPTPSTWSSSARSPGGAAAPGSTARCCWPPTTRPPTCSAPSASAAPGSPTPTWPRCPNGSRRWPPRTEPARVDARQQPDIWFEPGLVLEILSAELTLSPNYTAAWGRDQARRRPGHALPPVHRTMARRQGPRRRHHHAGAGRAVPQRPADTGGLNTLSRRSPAGCRGPGAVPRRPRTPPGPPAGARIGAAGPAAARRRRPGTCRPSASASR